MIPDEPPEPRDPDLIGNESYARRVYNAIKETTTTNSAFTIGVFSSWGSGKTDFLKRIENQLKQDSSENIVLQFSPWRTLSIEAQSQAFFKILSKGLEPYNRDIAKNIRIYSKEILSVNKHVGTRIFEKLIDNLFDNPTLQDQYSAIKETILETGKRIIILIDDLDRVTGPELIKLLTLIRNSADFPNTFFIVTLDYEYLIEVLKKTNLLAKEEEYLTKIFQLTVTIPKTLTTKFGDEIRKYLIDEKLHEEDRDKIEDAIYELTKSRIYVEVGFIKNEKSILEGLLDNFRDVKRFCNSFKINFEILKEDVDVTDLFLLELIKTKSLKDYNLLSSRKILTVRAEEGCLNPL